MTRLASHSYVAFYRKLEKAPYHHTTFLECKFCFLFIICSCCLWLNYGRLNNDHSVTLVNVIGSTLFLCYTVVYYVFTVNKTTLLKQFSMAWFVLLMSIAYIQYEDDHEQAVQATGILCFVVTVIFFAAPMTVLFHVIRTKNSESLPFPLISSTFVVSLQWLIYGILMNDSFIQLPNFLGCILSGTQLLLFIIYPSKSHYAGPSYKLLDQSAVF